jgi:hypothetical protein
MVIIPYLCAVLCSCTGQQADRSFAPRQTETPVDYAPLFAERPPFTIDVDVPEPFSRFGVPWADGDVVGLDIVWLALPTKSARLPRFALVINEYTENVGLLSLITEDGSVVCSIDDLGLIQKVRLVSIAPIEEPQILVYANSGHGTGACSGEIVLLEYSENELHVLLKAPRYEYTSLDGEQLELGFLILLRHTPDPPRIVVLTVAMRTKLGQEDDSSLFWAKCAPSCLEYEWDADERRFRAARSAQVGTFLTPDAWQWLPNYDHAGPSR